LISASVFRGQWAKFTVTSLAQDWSNSITPGESYTYTPDDGFFLNEGGNGQTYWHKFAAEENSTNQPYIQINYGQPDTPWGQLVTHSDNSSGYLNLWWNYVPNAASYNVLIWDGHQYESYNVAPQADGADQNPVQHWTSKDLRIWPTQSEITTGDWQLHHDKNGAELAMNPGSVYQNAYVANGSTGTNYGTDSNYWFRVEAVASDGSVSAETNAFTPTMQSYTKEEGQGSTMLPLFVGSADGATGNFVMSDTDLSTTGLGPQVDVSRTYNQNEANQSGPFGLGWTMGYQTSVVPDGNAVDLTRPDGSVSKFWPNSDGSFSSPPGETDWTLANDSNGGFKLTLDDNTTEYFDELITDGYGERYALSAIKDQDGNTLTFHWGTTTINGVYPLNSLTDQSGRTTTLSYNANAQITGITDAAGEKWSYGYTNNQLTSVTDGQGNTTKYGYAGNESTSVTTPNGNAYSIAYDANGNVSGETNPAGKSETVSYNQSTQSVTLTDPLGIQTVWNYNSDNEPTKVTLDPAGLNQVTTYEYDNGFGEVTKETNPAGKIMTYTYDAFGQPISVTDFNGNTSNETFGTSAWGSVDNHVKSEKSPAAANPFQFNYNSYNYGNSTAQNLSAEQTPEAQSVGDTYQMNPNSAQAPNSGLVASEALILPSNPLANSSYEQWTNGLPTGWNFGGSGTSTDSNDSYFGGNSWEVSGSSGSNPAQLSQATTEFVQYDTNGNVITPPITSSVFAKESSLAAANSTYLQINFFDGNGQWIHDTVSGSKLDVANQWARLSVSVNTSQIPANAVTYHPIIVTAPTGSDNVKFDAMDFSSASVPEYNAIVNGDFSNQTNNWTLLGGTLSTNATITYGSNNGSAQITDSPSAYEGLVPTDSNEYIPYEPGQSYHLSAYLYGDNASNSFVTFEYFNSS
jgi:YD repeat-containing protein